MKYLTKVYKVESLAITEISTATSHKDAQQIATQMAMEGILDFKKPDIKVITLSFEKIPKKGKK